MYADCDRKMYSLASLRSKQHDGLVNKMKKLCVNYVVLFLIPAVLILFMVVLCLLFFGNEYRYDSDAILEK